MKHKRIIGWAFHDQAGHNPDAIAILASGQSPMTYRDLNAQTIHVKEFLTGIGLGRGDRVATVIANGPEMVALFASVTGSATIVPLNTTLTSGEYEALLKDLEAKAIIVQSGGEPRALQAAEKLQIGIIELTADLSAPAGTFRLSGAPIGEIRPYREPEMADVALILHTSGTTSRPKMVPLSYQNLLASANNFTDWYQLKPSDRSHSFMPYFHIQGIIGGILAPLVSGGSIVSSRGFDGDSFFELLGNFSPNWYTGGPTYHQAIVGRAARHTDIIANHPLRFIRSSSAPLAPQTMQALEEVFGAPVVEGFGLTETCLHSVSNPLPPAKRKPGCVGLPAGTEVAVIDGSGAEVAAGASGEVVLRGPTVMSSYLNNAGENIAAFVNGWFRTGDQGYFDADGYLVLTGRFKELINRGGEKIAPIEIDHVLLDHPEIMQAVAFSVPHPTLGEEVGVAIVRRKGSQIDEAEVRAFASGALAAFKVPRHVVFLDAIPKSTVGKSQRLGLAAQLGLDQVLRGSTADQTGRAMTPTESEVMEIWKSVLQHDEIGLNEEFIALGGDSLQANHVFADVASRFKINLPFAVIFDAAASVAGMSQLIDSSPRGQNGLLYSPLKHQDRGTPLPASFTQQSFWVGSHLFVDQPVYNVVKAIRLGGNLDLDVLNEALAFVVDRQESLRIFFEFTDGQLLMTPKPSGTIALEITEYPGSGGKDATVKAAAWAREESQRPIDVISGQLWYMKLFRIAETDHVLLAVLHHSITDGWGSEILIDDLLTAYGGLTHRTEIALPSLDLQFGDFAAWQRGCWEEGEFNADLDHWRSKLGGAPAAPSLPSDRQRGNLPDWRGERQEMLLPLDMTSALHEVSRIHHASLFMTLLAGFYIFLHAQTDRTDIIVGVPMANRAIPELEKIAGCFVNALPFRDDLQGDPSFEELLERVRETSTDAFAHQQIPREILLEELNKEHGLGREPFFNILFQLRNYHRIRENNVGGLTAVPFEFDPGIVVSEVDVDWQEQESGLLCGFNYSTELFRPKTVTRWMAQYKSILEAIADNPAVKIADLADTHRTTGKSSVGKILSRLLPT